MLHNTTKSFSVAAGSYGYNYASVNYARWSGGMKLNRKRRWKSLNRTKPHEGADVSGEIASAGRRAEIFLRVQPVRVHHEVTVRQVAAVCKKNRFFINNTIAII